jgi:hypothetical protein
MLRSIGLCLALMATGSAALPVPSRAGDWREDYERILKAIHPRPGESPWLAIPWLTSLSESRRRAAAEGKPIFVWGMSGEPLGCA